VAGFAVYIALMAVEKFIPAPVQALYLARILITAAVIVLLSRGVISFRCVQPLGSVALGVAVCGIWVLPDVLWPGYRQHWLFENALTGAARSSLSPELRADFWFLALRSAGSALLVPVIEELMWRAWLMRYLIQPEFEKVPLGAYTAQSFWLVAVLFASEHGPYWEVGLAAGVVYNWWMLRTRSLGDCILAHAVTNACLAAFIIATGQWQFWL
jgi:uncharacterized protein